MNPPKWSIEDKEYLRLNYLELSVPDLSHKLHRSEQAIKSCACTMRHSGQSAPAKKPCHIDTPEQKIRRIAALSDYFKRNPHLSAKHKARISSGNKGKRAGKTWEEIFGEAQAARIRKGAIGRFVGEKSPCYGTHKSEAEKLAQSKRMKGRWIGPNHHNWTGGGNGPYKYLMSSPEWIALRKGTYERDGWTCQICGRHCQAKEIQCHHIAPYGLSGDNSPENLITLCVSCHRREEWAFYRNESLLGNGVGTALAMCINLHTF